MVIDESRIWFDGLGLHSQKDMLLFVMLKGNTQFTGLCCNARLRRIKPLGRGILNAR